MAGHSKFKNIMHRKGAQDKKRAKVFGRLIKELTVAARSSTDPDSNPRLRSALAAARAANMPKDNIERVLKRAEGGEGENYDDCLLYTSPSPRDRTRSRMPSSA